MNKLEGEKRKKIEFTENVLLCLLTAVRETSKWTMAKIFAIQDMMKEFRTSIKAKAPSIYSKELVELLFTQPYVRISNLVEMDLMGRDTASKHLKTLCEIGFLGEAKKGRDKFFINHQFLSLLKSK